MYKRVLIALDLEGVNKVIGTPYEGLSVGTEQYEIARVEATLEVNSAANALFCAGAESVALWDSHGGKRNLDASKLDPRIEILDESVFYPRFSFAANGRFDCVGFIGFHTMEGTLGGVLAHTMNSRVMQYYKIDGRHVGEVDIDAYLCASHGLPSAFFVGDDLACAQAKRSLPNIITVTTKKSLSRNEAIFRDNDELIPEMCKRIVEAVSIDHPVKRLALPCVFEKSFKRIEDAANAYKRAVDQGLDVHYLADEILGHDAHTIFANIKSIDEFNSFI